MSDIISDLILEMKKKIGITSVVITHDMHSAFKISDYIAFLYEGEIMLYGTKPSRKSLERPTTRMCGSLWTAPATGPYK